MPILLHHINYRNIPLTNETANETVPVRLKNGEYRFVRWVGFIDIREAKKSLGTPVKIRVNSYSLEDINPRWIVLEGKHVQGCLLDEGVYGVLVNNVPRVLVE